MDDDDEWAPTKTEEQLQLLKRYDAVLCRSDEPIAGAEAYRRTSTVGLDDLRRGRFTAGGTGVLMARAAIVRGALFDETLPCYQDWDVFIHIAQQCTVGYLDRPLLRYNEGEHGRISNKILNMPPEELERRLVMLRKHADFFGPRWYKRHLCRNLLYGIKFRRKRLRYLVTAARRCGVGAVSWAFLRRFLPSLGELL